MTVNYVITNPSDGGDLPSKKAQISMDDLPPSESPPPIPQEAAILSLKKEQALFGFYSHLQKGDEAGAQKMIARGELNFRDRDQEGRGVLHYAAMFGAASILRRCLSTNIDMSPLDHQKNTPLHWAAYYGHHECIQVLIQGKADVRLANQGGEAPLDSIFSFHPHLVPLLADLIGIDKAFLDLCLFASPEALEKIGAFETFFGQMKTSDRVDYLRHLLKEGELQIARWLVKDGHVRAADQGKDGRSALHVAAFFNDTELLELLSSDSLEIRDPLGRTPLHEACIEGSLEAILWLIQKGADCNAQDTTTRTPIIFLLEKHPYFATEMLQAVGDKTVLDIGGSQKAYSKLSSRQKEEIEKAAPFGEMFLRIATGHAWGVKGDSILGKVKARYEGAVPAILNERIFDLFQEFLYGLDQDHPYASFGGQIEQFAKDMDLSPEEIAQKIERGETVLLLAQHKDHTIYFVFFRGWCCKCNRGMGAKEAGIEIFEIGDPANLKKAVAKVHSLEWSSQMIGYFNRGIDRDLSLKKIGVIGHKFQTVGNCSLASLKTAFHAMLIGEAFKQGLNVDEAYRVAHETYKQFTAFLRKELLKEHLMYTPDPGLLSQIQGKLKDVEHRLKGVFRSATERLRLADSLAPFITT